VTGPLTLDGVELVIDGRQILQPFSVEFRPGEVTAVSGPSGSGKTSLLSVAGGLIAPSAGTAAYDGRPTWRGDGDPPPEVAFVLQVYGLVPILTALENVAIALRARGVDASTVEERAVAALDRFHIGDLGERQVEELSGGQMQRVACARAFVTGADILLADEPTSELDEGNREHVMAELRVEAGRGAIVVVATHDTAVVDASDRRLAIDEGALIDQPAPAGRHRLAFGGCASVGHVVRGLLWRGASALTLVCLTAAVVAGCLASVRYSELTDTPVGSIGVLLVLGAVVTSVQASATARGRRNEIALAQIRGRHGVGLLASFLVEPVVLVVVGSALGVAVGKAALALAVRAWLDQPSGHVDDSISHGAWIAAGAAVGCVVASVIAGSWRVVREPLIEQLDESHRPEPPAAVVLLGQTGVVVAAAVAGYESTQHAGVRDGWGAVFDPSLLTPVLLGLAAGQAAIWTARGVGAAMTRSGRHAFGVARFLAIRRLARRSDTAFGARVVIAAGVVAAVTLSAGTAARAWQDESTRIAMGGPLRYTVDDGAALAAYQATHDLDPDGRWLMTMVSAPDKSEAYRRAFADMSRWRSVVGDFYAGTGAASIADHAGELETGAPVRPAVGDSISVAFDASTLAANLQVAVSVYYVTPRGGVGTAILRAPKSAAGGTGTVEVTGRVRTACQAGCVVTQVVIDGYRIRPYHDLVISDLRFGDVSLLDDAWRGDNRYGRVRQDADGLHVRLSVWGDSLELRPAAGLQPLAALWTPGLVTMREGRRAIGYAVDGREHVVEPVGTVAMLPFVGRQGMLMDLSRALAVSTPVIPTATTYIVARADTPPSVLDRLTATGLVGEPTDVGSALAAASERPDAQGVRLYSLMSGFAALIALLGMASSAAAQRRDRRHEAASLRVSGVPSRTLTAAIRTEAVWLALMVFALVAAVGWAASRVAIENLELVPISPYSPLLTSTPSLRSVAIAAAGAGVVVGLGTFLAYRSIARTSPPRILRGGV
jgi:putative ABC transport system ATP-binding protein